MRANLALAATLAITAGLTAQNVQNHTQMWDQTTEFTSRGGNGGNAGFVAQGFQYGFSAGLKTMTRAQYVMQDQNLATQETWAAGTNTIGANGDHTGPGALNAYATNLTLPTGTGIGAFLVTHTPLLANPHNNTENGINRWFHTWRLDQTANWTTDGISVHMSQGAPYRGTRLCTGGRHREISRTDSYSGPAVQIVEKLAWTGVANNPRPTWNDRTWRQIVSFNEALLKGFSSNSAWNAPCPDPNPGYASISPNINDLGGQTPARNDDPVWEVRDNKNAADTRVALFLLATKNFGNGGIPIPNLGTLHVDLSSIFFQIGIPMSGGAARLTFPLGGAAIRNAAADLGMIACQGAVLNINKNTVELTNPWNMVTKLVPTGWTHATAAGAGAGAANIAHNATPVPMSIRNDGIGQISVQPQRGSTNLGPATVVGERSCVTILLPAGTNNVNVSSPSNTDTARPTDFVYKK